MHGNGTLKDKCFFTFAKSQYYHIIKATWIFISINNKCPIPYPFCVFSKLYEPLFSYVTWWNESTPLKASARGFYIRWKCWLLKRGGDGRAGLKASPETWGPFMCLRPGHSVSLLRSAYTHKSTRVEVNWNTNFH